MAFDNNRHSIAYSTKLIGCMCYSFISETNLDNGMLIAKGALADGEREIYTAGFDIKKPAYLVLNPAWNYDDSTYAKKNDEGLYYNEACKPFRGYELNVGKRYEVTSDICTDELVKGDYVIATAAGKLAKNTSATAPDNAFVGQVVDVVSRGFAYSVGSAGSLNTAVKTYVIEVIKNEEVI